MLKFNRTTPNCPDIKYYSYGASFTPTWGSVFRTSHNIIAEKEGDNDGLVSVKSSMWGEYKGTIQNVNHLDIINWVRSTKSGGYTDGRLIGLSIGGMGLCMVRNGLNRRLMRLHFICMLLVCPSIWTADGLDMLADEGL